MRKCSLAVRLGAGAVVLGALAGCGGGGDNDTPEIGGDLSADFVAMQERLDQLFNTAFLPPDNAIPTSGTAEFAGFVNVDVAGAADPLELTGRAEITADFGASTLTGTARDFQGRQAGVLSDYAGSVTFLDGRIGRSPTPLAGEQPNDVRLGYLGTLDGAGNTVVLDGTATGKLKGSPIQGLVAASGPGETVDLNGTDTAATVTIVAETD